MCFNSLIVTRLLFHQLYLYGTKQIIDIIISIPSNPIMDAIEKLNDISKDAGFAEATYCNNKNEVYLLKDFWDCNEEQAASIAPYVYNQLTYFIYNKCIAPIKDLKLYSLTSLSISNSI